ncbi:hypothetical protein [Zestomonas carbonaria]|uniref:Uncharacterized protein n=1 Tax=Zestomonas carbonaria TaxID=2762745 RepID=A0A7U7ES47_9GAMM|nr:hypothetical protein [Pseudomonas carbonaria]CAD5110148.1 hypothetical protein PSEWESI4_04465 [Pseudomonas carbonaria]
MSTESDESFLSLVFQLVRALFALVWELFKLIAPIAALTLLPPPFALGTVLLAALASWAAVRLRWMRLAHTCSSLMDMGVFGLSFSVCYWLSSWWGLGLGFVLLIVGIILSSSLQRRLGLAKVLPESTEGTSTQGRSAWEGGDLLTPEGERVRTFAWGEIAMGGPTFGCYLFPDGVLLEGLGASACFSSSGRYFAAPLPSRGTWGMLILDRQERCVYRNAGIGEFWEIDELTDEAIYGRYSPLTGNKPYRMALADILRQSEAVDLVPIRDLWVESGFSLDLEPVEFPAPQGGHCLRGLPYVPESLRELDRPLGPLLKPLLRLELDGEPSGLLMSVTEVLLWRNDGQAVACRAFARSFERQWCWHGDWPPPLWLWQAGQGWRQLVAPWGSVPGEPALNWEEPSELLESELLLHGHLRLQRPDHLHFGYGLRQYFSDVESCIGHDDEGRIQLGEWRGTRLTRLLPLDGKGRRGEGAILGEPMENGDCPRFEWRRDSRDGRLGAYACRVGDWVLEGEWLIDHRVSNCGRYLALVAFVEAPAVPHRLCVADLRLRRLLEFPFELLIATLLDFRDDVLSLVHIVGRLDMKERSTPLRRFDHAAPAAGRAARFVADDPDSWLYYDRLVLRVAEDDLQVLPNWRLAGRPQVANADGEFVLPAPTGRDAAWLFGAETEYADCYPRPGEPRGGGCLLTASGLGLANLGPSMIWSEDGRYLALTRYIRRLCARERVDSDQWYLLLLDVQERSLRATGDHIGCMPHFLRFDAEELEWRVQSTDWEPEDRPPVWQTRRLALGELLALCTVPLQASGKLWLPAEELKRAGQWHGLDSSHLQPWRN